VIEELSAADRSSLAADRGPVNMAVDGVRHVRQASLPAPGGDAELGAFVGREFSHRLDRARPLWEATLLEGLAGDGKGLLMKVHHALARRDRGAQDGGAGARPERGAARDPAAGAGVNYA
jgi:Wax ester synthase-like Acyl-CoA acyltransferase domain